jgi:hypothetical protein
MKTELIESNSITITKNYPLRIAAIADPHTGSIFSPILNPITQTQKKLNKIWDKYVNACNDPDFLPNVLFVVGDVIAGTSFKDRGKYLCIPTIDGQIDASVELITDFVKKVPSIKKVYVWGGTPYHGSIDTTVEKTFTTGLRAEQIDAKYMHEYTLFKLEHGEYKKTLLVMHPTSSSSAPETALGLLMRQCQEKIAQGKLPPLDMTITAHKHEFVEVHKSSIRALQLPAWQLFVPYDGALKNIGKYQPDIGGVIITYDDKLRSIPHHFTEPSFIPDDYQHSISVSSKIQKKEIDKKHKEEIDRLR